MAGEAVTDRLGLDTVTISQGKVVYQDGEIRTERGVGRYIDRPTHAPYYDAVQKRRELDAPSAVDRM